MQLDKASNDLLIFRPSLCLSPQFLLTAARSLPARSMIESVAELTHCRTTCFCMSTSVPFPTRPTLICKMACDRDDCELASVGEVDRLWLPIITRSMTSSTELGRFIVT